MRPTGGRPFPGGFRWFRRVPGARAGPLAGASRSYGRCGRAGRPRSGRRPCRRRRRCGRRSFPPPWGRRRWRRCRCARRRLRREQRLRGAGQHAGDVQRVQQHRAGAVGDPLAARVPAGRDVTGDTVVNHQPALLDPHRWRPGTDLQLLVGKLRLGHLAVVVQMGERTDVLLDRGHRYVRHPDARAVVVDSGGQVDALTGTEPAEVPHRAVQHGVAGLAVGPGTGSGKNTASLLGRG